VQATRRPESSVEDDFLLHLHYPSTSVGGLRITLGASCVSPFLDAEQPRFIAQGLKGSYLKRGLDPQENQLKAGLSPTSSNFGSYSDSERASLRLGRLTTSVPPKPAKEGEAPNQPLLASADIPTLPGAYVRFYEAVAAAIRGEEKPDSFVTLQQMKDNTRALLLCRKSAEEGRSVKWTEEV
jgi:predicted dehydrogenase